MEKLLSIRTANVLIVSGLFLGLLIVTVPSPAKAYDSFYISGTVYNENNNPVPFADVTCLKNGTTYSLETEANACGEYSFDLADFGSGYDSDDVFILYTTSDYYATLVTGCGIFAGQTSYDDCNIYGPIFTDGSWCTNGGLANRDASLPAWQNLIQANPWYIDTGESWNWWLYTGWAYTDYNNDPSDDLHVSMVVIWKIQQNQFFTSDTSNLIQYDLSPGNGCSGQGWLCFSIARGSYTGWCSLTLTYSGSFYYGSDLPTAFSIQYTKMVNIQWV